LVKGWTSGQLAVRSRSWRFVRLSKVGRNIVWATVADVISKSVRLIFDNPDIDGMPIRLLMVFVGVSGQESHFPALKDEIEWTCF
jgi:hypothetical protein